MTASSLALLQIPFRTSYGGLLVNVAAADFRWTMDGPATLLRAVVDFPPFGFPNGFAPKVVHAARPVTVECFFDFSSPRTYLGFHQLHGMRAQCPNVTFVFRPMLVGGIFNSVNPFVCAIPLASR